MEIKNKEKVIEALKQRIEIMGVLGLYVTEIPIRNWCRKQEKVAKDILNKIMEIKND